MRSYGLKQMFLMMWHLKTCCRVYRSSSSPPQFLSDSPEPPWWYCYLIFMQQDRVNQWEKRPGAADGAAKQRQTL